MTNFIWQGASGLLRAGKKSSSMGEEIESVGSYGDVLAVMSEEDNKMTTTDPAEWFSSSHAST